MERGAGGRENSSAGDQPARGNVRKDGWGSLEIPAEFITASRLFTNPQGRECATPWIRRSVLCIQAKKKKKKITWFERFLFNQRTQFLEMSLCKILNSFQLQRAQLWNPPWPLTYTLREAKNFLLEIIKELHYYKDVKNPNCFSTVAAILSASDFSSCNPPVLLLYLIPLNHPSCKQASG